MALKQPVVFAVGLFENSYLRSNLSSLEISRPLFGGWSHELSLGRELVAQARR